MGGDWPLRRVSRPPDRRIRETRRVLRHREGSRSRGCHLAEGPPSGPPTHVKPHSLEWGLFRPLGGASPPPEPPLVSPTIPHPLAPPMLQLLRASPSDRLSCLGTRPLVLRSFPPLLLPSPLLPRLPHGFGGGVAAPSHPGRFVDQRITLVSGIVATSVIAEHDTKWLQ